MATPAIAIRDVVKQYRVKHEKGRTLKELFLRHRIYQETIRALDHVDLEIPEGRTMGVIGSNGSGKSTLLKLIARTSMPTSGSVEVNGRVSALLELGAGFHPDFTGRENVYLDGAIMGLPRRVVAERFDEIVRFAEMEQFIDAPAKTYSSGMYLRLAFSVAVSIDPDIILIDEVFAVGDESFQRKCMERMDDFKREGKTIVFVSHSLDAVRSLCDEAVWLDRGKVMCTGSTTEVIDRYLDSVNEEEEKRLAREQGVFRDEGRWGSYRAEITSVSLEDGEGNPKHIFRTGDRLRARIAWKANVPVDDPVFGMAIHRGDGVLCFGTNTSGCDYKPEKLEGEGELSFELDSLALLPGSYFFSFSCHSRDDSEIYDYHDRRYPFRVVDGPRREVGLVHMEHRWRGWGPGTGKA